MLVARSSADIAEYKEISLSFYAPLWKSIFPESCPNDNYTFCLVVKFLFSVYIGVALCGSLLHCWMYKPTQASTIAYYECTASS